MATGLDAQQKIFASNPDDRRVFEGLEEHFFFEGAWDALVQLYRDRIAAPSVEADESLRGPVLFRLGQILEERVLDAEAAIEVYWTLARMDPTNRPALRQLRRIHERRTQWDMVLQIAELESATTMPPYERAAFESELGRTWQDQLADPDEARACFERALEADSEFPAALAGLAQLHRDAGRWAEAATILERLTRRPRSPERAPAWIALGWLYAGPLEASQRARKCFAAALDDDPFQAPAIEWSLLLATADEDWPVVSELLESCFDLASGARHRSAIAVEASQIQLNHLESPARARAWVDRALELCPEEPSVLLAASDVERNDGDREALLENLDKLITLSGPNAPQAALVEAAELHADFGNPDAALDAIRRAGHSDERILTLHARLLREGGAKRELAEVLETLVALDPGRDASNRAEQLRELATLQEDDLGDDDAARVNWRRAFDLEPGSGPAIDALDRIYQRSDDWDALREVLEAALGTHDDEPPASLPAQLGKLTLEHFEDAARARALFETALSIDASCELALAGLRTLADASGDPDLMLEICEREAARCDDPDQIDELARSVIPILEERNEIEEALRWATRWSECSSGRKDAFERRAYFESRLDRPQAEIESRRILARLQTGRDRGTTLERQAALHVELGQDLDAGTALELALESHADPQNVLTSLCDVYRRLKRPQDLVRALRQLTDLLPPDEQPDLLEELASTLQDPLGDIDAAIVVKWRLVDLPDGPAEAFHELESLLESVGRYSELAHLLATRRQRVGGNSPEAFELDTQRATILLDSLGHCEEAAEILAALHECHPESNEIIDLYERALRSGDDAAGLCELLEQRAGWEPDEACRAKIQLERAALMEEGLEEPLEACDLYEEILTLYNGSEAAERAGERLEALLEFTSQWERLRERLNTRAEALPEEEEATLREGLAALCRDRLSDFAGCAEQLEIVAQLESNRVDVWQQLEEIYAQKLDRPADWLRVVKAELDCVASPEREFMLRVGAARLCLDEDRRPEGSEVGEAYEHYQRVLELDPGHAEAAEVLAMHFSSEDRHDETAKILEARLASVEESDGPEATEIRLRLASLLCGPLNDDERARPLLEHALERLGPIPQVADPLAELYGRGDAHEAARDLARAVLGSPGEGHGELVWWLRLGESEYALGHFDEAAIAYRAALAESPNDHEIETTLIEIYERVDEIEPLTELLEKHLSLAREDENIDLRLRLARLHAERRNEPEQALVHLEWILDSLPQHRDAFNRAVELTEQSHDNERLLSLLDRSLGTSLPNHERAEILERRADLFANELDRPDQAVLSLRESISFDRSRKSARTSLRLLLERLERWPAVLDCLFVEAMEKQNADRYELFEEASEIAWSRINPDASLPWLARMLEERPQDPELYARLAEVHRRAGRFEAALRALDDELDRRTDDAERCRLHLQRARLLERDLHAPGRAIHAYREALERSDDKAEILRELDRLYDLMGRTPERAEILEARIELLDDDKCFELRKAVSALFCTTLAKPERAIPHLVANVETSRHDPQGEIAALGALDAALRASGRHDQWVHVAERELAIIENDPVLKDTTPREFKRTLREELARTYDTLMGDSERALGHLRVLCRTDGEFDPVLGERLRKLLRRTGRLPELASELVASVERRDDDGAAWLELAQIREERLLDLRGARDAYRAAESDPEQILDAVRGRRRCSERLRDWQGLADAIEAEYGLDDLLEPAQRAALARRLGDVYWHRLGAGERAARGYQLALDLDANDLEALRSLILVKEACCESVNSIALYRRELEILADECETRSRRREIWLRVATLSIDACEHPGDAIEAYRAAAELEHLSAPDELRLARLFETVGDMESFCECLGHWCDRSDSEAGVSDHLEVARALVARGDSETALIRSERATAVAPESDAAWALLAHLARDAGHCEQAATAFERAADHASPDAAADHCTKAAACAMGLDIDRSHRLLLRAIELDPAALGAHVALTRVAHRLERLEETERAAQRSLDLARAEPIDDAERLEVAVLGGCAARELGRRDASRGLFEIALEIDADQPEALECVGFAHFEDGDFCAARVALERRIDLPGENRDRAQHLAIIARGLEAENHLDVAWARYEEAIEADPSLQNAHEGVVRVHERAARPEEALAALERWSEAPGAAETRALTHFRAAEHALALEDTDRAIEQLECATEVDPRFSSAWVLLCDLMGERGPDSDVRTLCARALDSIEPSSLSAQISLRAARLAEIAGETEEAREHYRETARWDPSASDAALCESRLARMAGDWVEADAVLKNFIEAHPNRERRALAHIYLERGRLLSGPLEDFDQAVAAYQSALALQPEMGVARASLARLLLHAPERWRESLALHREILASSPTTADSLRAIGQIAKERGESEVEDGAITVLRALGLASPQEEASAPTTLRFPIDAGPQMVDPEAERLRRLAHQMREELSAVLAGSGAGRPDDEDPQIADAIRQIGSIEDELCAPGLARLETGERATLFSTLVALSLDPGGTGHESQFRTELEESLGRWTRRKIRRSVEETTLREIEALDHQAWGDDLRAMAAARSVDRHGGDLRCVLRALLVLESADSESAAFEGARIGTLASTSEPARRLLAHITNLLCERLERSH